MEAITTKQKDLVSQIADYLPYCISYINHQLQFKYINKALEDWLGLSRDQVINRSIKDIMGPDLFVKIKPLAEKALAGEQVTFQQTRLSPNGELKVFQITYIPDRHTNSDSGGIISLVQDITEQSKTQERLRLSEERFQLASRATNETIWDWNLETNAIEWNYASETLFGYSTEQVGTDLAWWVAQIHPEDQERVTAGINAVIESRVNSWTAEYRFRRADNFYSQILDRGYLIRDKNGQAMRMIGAMLDITERKQIEQALKESEERYRQLVELSPYMVSVNSGEKFEYINQAGVTLLGANQPEEVLEKEAISFVSPEWLASVKQRLNQVLHEGKQAANQELELMRLDGQPVMVETKSVPILYNGRPASLGVTRDITEQHRMQELMLAQTTVLKEQAELLELAHDSIMATDLEGHITFWNRGAEMMYGFQREEVVGLTVHDILQTRFPMPLQDIMAILNKEGHWEGEIANTRKDGRTLTVASRMAVMTSSIHGSKKILEISTDITARKEVEDAYHKSAEAYRTMARNFPNGAVCLFDRDFRYLIADGTGLEEAGLSQDLMEGKTIFEVYPPQTCQDIEPDYRAALAGQTTVNEVPFAGRVYKTYTLPVAKENGEIFAGMVMTQDITAQKQAEEWLKIYASKLEQSNRELEEFAQVASHDLQEPLRKIIVFGERLKNEAEEHLTERERDSLERMQNASRRMQTLITDLLAFSRVTTRVQPFTPVNLEKLVQEVIGDLEARISQTGGQVELANLPAIDADPIQMRQLFQNLIGNALKFHRTNITPYIKVYCRIAGDRQVEILVEDNGIGFDEKYLDRIFTVFQRLHGRNEYEGTGVGLAICRKIVARHHGTITAKSNPGQGSTFIVCLPLQQNSGE